MVELYLNNQKVDLRGNETIATDYSIAPIGNIASRGSAKSVTFKLPLTANNREIIENANVIVNSTVIPYRLVPAKLYANGLTQQIEFAQIKSIKDDISITLFGSNVDFFGIVKGLKILDLGDVWDHQWTRVNTWGSRNNTSGYIYAMIDYNADDYMDPAVKEIDVRTLLPSVFLHSIISEIITQAGFTAEGDFLNDAHYKSVLIPCMSRNLGRYGELLLSRAHTSADKFITNIAFVDNLVDDYDPLNLIANEAFDVDYPGIGSVGVHTLSRYAVPSNLTYRFKVKYDYTGLTAPASEVLLVRQDLAGTSHVIKPITLISASGSIEFNEVADCLIGDRVFVIFFQIGAGMDSVTILAGSTFEVVEVTGDPYSNTLDVTANLPDLKQSELLKDTAQKFGLIFQVDNIRKVVHIRQFSEIIDAIPNAKDWSDKVDYSEKTELQFDSDYAQLNTCIYEDDDTVIKPEGTDSEITINNAHLKKDLKLFESPFAASELVQRFDNVSIAQIKLFTDYGTADETVDEVEPRYLVKRMNFFDEFHYTDGTQTDDFTDEEIPVTHFILPGYSFNAGFANNLLDNSTDLIALIQQFKTVKMLMRITAADINQLDFFIPIWIELVGQIGCYFYISEIKQFKVTNNESTDVELVKLS